MGIKEDVTFVRKIHGRKPDTYSFIRQKTHHERIYANLLTHREWRSIEWDSMMSLHANRNTAQQYVSLDMKISEGPLTVYVTKKTLEKIVKSEDKVIFTKGC